MSLTCLFRMGYVGAQSSKPERQDEKQSEVPSPEALPEQMHAWDRGAEFPNDSFHTERIMEHPESVELWRCSSCNGVWVCVLSLDFFQILFTPVVLFLLYYYPEYMEKGQNDTIEFNEEKIHPIMWTFVRTTIRRVPNHYCYFHIKITDMQYPLPFLSQVY